MLLSRQTLRKKSQGVLFNQILMLLSESSNSNVKEHKPVTRTNPAAAAPVVRCISGTYMALNFALLKEQILHCATIAAVLAVAFA
jgi:hypothetical protein